MVLSSPVVRSDNLYRTYWLYWRLLCVEGDFRFRKALDILINIFVTFWCPAHLMIGLFLENSIGNVSRNMPIMASSFCSSFKFVCFRLRLREIKQIEKLFTELDQRAVSKEERSYFERVTRKETDFLWKSVLLVYGLSNLGAILTVLFSHKLVPAWFPYDTQASALNYWISFLYQSISGILSTVENLANTTYTPMTFCILSGHVRLLAMRLGRLGHGKNNGEISSQLAENIEDYKKLMQIVRLLRSTMHISQLGQFVVSGINISSCLIYAVFFAESTFAAICYVVYFMSMVVELLPSCYYGSLVTLEFNGLPKAIFSSNWIGMDRKYIRSMMLFVETMQMEVKIKAGGIISISMDAFFATLRMTYSYFTLAMSFR